MKNAKLYMERSEEDRAESSKERLRFTHYESTHAAGREQNGSYRRVDLLICEFLLVYSRLDLKMSYYY